MNKKLLLIVPIFSLLLCGCSFSNRDTSTSEPTSTSSSTPIPPEQFDVDTIFGQVGYSLNKYNPEVNIAYMENNTDFKGKTEISIKDFLNVGRKVLTGLMPEVKGARKYQGYFGSIYTTRELTPEEQEDLDFFHSYGIIEENYDPDYSMTLADVRMALARIHQYFGTSQKDDFASTIMKDWLYDHDDQDGKTSADDVYESTLVSSSNMYKNGIELLLEAKNDPNYASLASVYDVYSGDTPFILTDKTSKFNDDLHYIEDNIDDYSSIISTEQHFMNEGYQCSFIRNPSLEIGQDYPSQEYVLAWSVQSDPISTFTTLYNNYYDYTTNDFDIESYWEDKGETISTYASILGWYSTIETDSIANNYKLFLQKIDDILTESGKKAGTLSSNLVIDNFDALNYLTSTTDANPSYKSFFSANYIDTYNGLYGRTDCMFNCLLGRFLELAKTDTSLIPLYKSFAYLSYFTRNLELLDIQRQDGKISKESLLNLLGYPITSYFQTTAKYTYAKTKIRDVFDKLIYSLKANAVTNGWLSSGGVDALNEKADLVTASLFGSYEGEDYNFSSFYKNIPFTSDIALDLILIQKAKFKMLADWTSSDKTIAYAATLLMEPFTANAFYWAISNSITITMGYLASIGFDLSSISNEELLATFGLVVGHEITHGFDSNGCYYDGHGHYAPGSIFPEQDLTAFEQKQAEVKKLYTLEVMPGIMQSGQITISEDLADLGGMSLCHRIANDNFPNFDYREFYIQVAKHFMSKISRRTYFEKEMYKNVHALAKARCNPLLMNCPKFIELFGIKNGDGMYRDPNDHIIIW